MKRLSKILPDSAPSQLRSGLIEAHRKLSEYHYRSDESPFYTSSINLFPSLADLIFLVLEPRIMYEGLTTNCDSYPSLLDDIFKAKDKSKTFYRWNYANLSGHAAERTQSATSISSRNTSGSFDKVNSPHATRRRIGLSLTNSKSTSSYPVKILSHVIHYNGGSAGALSFLDCIALPVMYSQSQVCSESILTYSFILNTSLMS